MSIESAKKFYAEIQKNDAFRAKLEAASKEEKPQILKDAGYDFTKEDLKEVVTSSTELSADDLDKIAGGKAVGWVKTVGGIVGTSVGSAF